MIKFASVMLLYITTVCYYMPTVSDDSTYIFNSKLFKIYQHYNCKFWNFIIIVLNINLSATKNYLFPGI